MPTAPASRRLPRSARLLGTVVVLAAATIALIPKEAETWTSDLADKSPVPVPPDLAETVRPAVAAAVANAAEVFWKTSNLAGSATEVALPPRALAANGFSPKGKDSAVAAKQAVSHLIPGQNLAIRTELQGDLRNLIYRTPSTADLRLTHLAPPYAASGQGRFEMRLAYVTGRIERSLFEAAQAAGLSDPLIVKLAEIFGWDIDFALDVRPGDAFGVVYEQRYWLGRKISDGPILAAEFRNRGNVYRAIGFRGPDGAIGYYTPTGESLKRTFLRTPVKFSRVSSRFTESRYHPVLKLWRAHTGVDYAAPPGTPVRATASGRITSLGRNGGYGNTVVINHGGAFSTLYAHLSRFHASLKVGRRVEQGDVIGYVGATGLATGAHLHYEFLVDGQHKNPLTFEFPGGPSIAEEARADFLRVAREWVARLELIGSRHLATAATH